MAYLNTLGLEINAGCDQSAELLIMPSLRNVSQWSFHACLNAGKSVGIVQHLRINAAFSALKVAATCAFVKHLKLLRIINKNK